MAWHKNSIDDPGNWKGDDPENRIWPWMTQGTNLLQWILRRTVSLRNQKDPISEDPKENPVNWRFLYAGNLELVELILAKKIRRDHFRLRFLARNRI